VAAILRESLPDAAAEPPHSQWILQDAGRATLPRVRAIFFLAVVGVAVVTACGASSATRPRPIQLGFAGGNVAGYTISIRSTGRVTISGGFANVHRRIPVKRVRRLGLEIQQAHLAKIRLCPGVLPDFASRYIRLGTHTFRLHGTCEPRFQRVWNDVVRAVGGLPK
jgi:hypothetical protein